MSLSNKPDQGASAGSRTDSWGAPAVPAACAEAAWLGILLAAPLLMNPAAARVFEATKLTALGPLAALLLAACLAAWPGRAGLPARGALLRPVAWALAGFYACAVLATVASEIPWNAFFGGYLRREGLASWLIAGGVCAAMLGLARGQAQVGRAIDALLLGCVMPCGYALLQRYGFVAGTGGEWQVAAPLLRPGGSLGNPVFFGDYMLLLIPLTLARCLAVRGALRARAGSATILPWAPCLPWLLLLALQGWVLLLTQSRAPLGALVIALWLSAVLLAGLSRSRRLLGAAFGLLACAVLTLAAINLVPDLSRIALATPGLQRFVLGGVADLSAASRMGIWQAGFDTLRLAPWPRQLFGHGFDVAYLHYFAQLPASVLQIEGALETIDRLHNEVMELAANLGLAGLIAYITFLGLVLRAAHEALGRGVGPALPGGTDGVLQARRARRSLCLFVLTPWPAGLLGALLAAALLGKAVSGIGFGLGAGAAWALLLSLQAWRCLRLPTGEKTLTAREITIAALAATVLAFWLDAQISLPVMSTRIVFFALVALLVVLANETDTTEKEGSTAGLANSGPAAMSVWAWGAGVSMVVAMVALFPAPFGYVVHVLTLTSDLAKGLWLATPGALALLVWWAAGAAPVGAQQAAATNQARQANSLRRWASLFLLCVLPAALGYFGLAAALHATMAQEKEIVLAAPILWMWLWLPCCCLGYGWWLAVQGAPALPEKSRKRGAARLASVTPGGGAWRVQLLAVLAVPLLALALIGGWAELRADLLVRLAGWAQAAGEPMVAAGYVARAAQILPQERQYRATVGTRRMERAVAQLRQARGADARQFLFVADELRMAEADMRAAVASAPGDPWTALGLANVVQFEGMTALRPLMGEQEGAAKAAQARALFARAHALFPVQTTILRNWAQLEFDGGDAPAAYRLLDEMEALLPASEEPYVERLLMARQAGDAGLYAATAARAERRLDAQAMERLRQALSLPH